MSFRYLLMVCFIALSIESTSQAGAPRQPNVILIYADDLGFADLGCYGNPYIRTPNIDRLAANGIRFTQAYAAAPVCSPSRAGILTGKSPAFLKITQYEEGTRGDSASKLSPAPFDKHLPYGIRTIATVFKSGGYTTGMVGKWHLGKLDEDQPGNFGFDYERVSNNGITYYDFSLLERNRAVYHAQRDENLTDRLTSEALTFINENKKKPFFLYLAHFAPHLLLQPKPQKLPYYYFNWAKKSQGRFDPQYAGTIETLDDNVGMLLAAIDSLGLRENTILVFTSDNGGLTAREFGLRPTDNSPLRDGKGFLYEGGIRVPLIISWPKHWEENKIIDVPVIQTQLLSTFEDVVGLRSINDLHVGKSFAALLKPGRYDAPPMFWHYPHFSNQGGRPSAAMRYKEFKLIFFYETSKYELFNLANDPGETKDVSANFPGIKNEMTRKLREWQGSQNAAMPSPKQQQK